MNFGGARTARPHSNSYAVRYWQILWDELSGGSRRPTCAVQPLPASNNTLMGAQLPADSTRRKLLIPAT